MTRVMIMRIYYGCLGDSRDNKLCAPEKPKSPLLLLHTCIQLLSGMCGWMQRTKFKVTFMLCNKQFQCFNILVSLCHSCLMQCEPENLEYWHFRLSPTGSVGGALLPPCESHCTNTRLSVTRQIHNVTTTQIQTHRSTNTLTALSLCKLLLRLWLNLYRPM